MNFKIHRGLFKKAFEIEVESDNAIQLFKLAKPYQTQEGTIKNPNLDFVREVVHLHKKNLILNYHLGKKVLKKEHIEDTSMHTNSATNSKHSWIVSLNYKEKGRGVLLLWGSN